MHTAVIIAEKAAAEAAAGTTINGNGCAADASTSSSSNGIVITTPGAIVENGKAYLRGNPLRTTPEILCLSCKLPRLLHPTTGKGSRPIPDPSKEYCAKRPFICKPGHDIHGNPFPTDKVVAKPLKARKNENGKASETKTSPLSSSDTLTASPPDADKDKSSITAEQQKEQVAPITFPTVKCPNCPRYLIVTRIAQHLDKCLGLSGRQSSRNAMKRMTETPRESRAGTPSATGFVKRKYAEEDSDEDDEPKKKKKRVVKKKPAKRPAAAAKTTKRNESKKKPAADKTTKKSTGPGTRVDEEGGHELEAGSLGRSHKGSKRGVEDDASTQELKDLAETVGKKVRKNYGRELDNGNGAEEHAWHGTGA